MRPHRPHISVLCATLALLAACDSSDCSDNRNSLPLAGFRTSGHDPQAISIDTLRIAGVGAPHDSVMTLAGASQAYLPLDAQKHSTTFVLRYDDMPQALYDTLTFTYDPQPWFGSAKCGVIYRYRMEDITHTSHMLDSVTCPGSVIDNTPGENIFIYFHTLPAPSAVAGTTPRADK